MQPRHALLSLVLVASIAVAAVAQPGFDLPPAGVSGIALGRVEDVHRVGAWHVMLMHHACSSWPTHANMSWVSVYIERSLHVS
jgi:hypothetical protein